MVGQKQISILIDEDIWHDWKNSTAKAKIVFEQGLKYRDVVDENQKLLGAVEQVKKEAAEAMDKKDKALAHMVDYIYKAERERNMAVKECVALRQELEAFRDRQKNAAPNLKEAMG